MLNECKGSSGVAHNFSPLNNWPWRLYHIQIMKLRIWSNIDGRGSVKSKALASVTRYLPPSEQRIPTTYPPIEYIYSWHQTIEPWCLNDDANKQKSEVVNCPFSSMVFVSYCHLNGLQPT